MSPIENKAGPSQNTCTQKRKLNEILHEVEDHKYNNQVLLYELVRSFNMDDDIVQVDKSEIPEKILLWGISQTNQSLQDEKIGGTGQEGIWWDACYGGDEK